MTRTRPCSKQGGVSLLEILIGIAIVLVLVSLSLASFSEFRARKSVDVAVEEILAAFSKAHLDAISSKNDMQYGVHLDPDKAVYFLGTTYDANAATNVVYRLNTSIEIANITLAGGGSDVIFKRLTGGTDQTGTFDIRIKGNTARRTTVTVNGTGAISL